MVISRNACSILINVPKCAVKCKRNRVFVALELAFVFGLFLMWRLQRPSLSSRVRKTLYDLYCPYFSPHVMPSLIEVRLVLLWNLFIKGCIFFDSLQKKHLLKHFMQLVRLQISSLIRSSKFLIELAENCVPDLLLIAILPLSTRMISNVRVSFPMWCGTTVSLATIQRA